MQYELPSPTHSRKRSSAWVTDEENNSQVYTPVNPADMPSKRFQNKHGEAVHAKPLLRYNAHKVLNHLAFTRFYVTANFTNFNPAEYFIILCMVSEQNELYQALWYVNQGLAVITASELTNIVTYYLHYIASHQSFRLLQ